MDLRKAKQAYRLQRRGAARRGIGWELTFEQWLEWWGEDLSKRGRGRYDLGMQRPCDSGPYALGNIRKGTPAENARTRKAMRPRVVAAKGINRHGRITLEHEDGMPNLGYATVWNMYG